MRTQARNDSGYCGGYSVASVQGLLESQHRDPRLPGDGQDRLTVVVYDHLPVFARGLARLLEEEASNLRVMSIEFGLEQARRSIADLQPAVALIGLGNDRAEEVEAVREICSAFPNTRIVVLLSEREVTIASHALAGAGVAGYVLKERDAVEIADVVRLVARGHIVVPADVALPSERRADPHWLDEVEQEILRGITRSETNRELAARLHLSERTICRRLDGIYSKLHLADRLQAAIYAAMHGLVRPFDLAPGRQ
jgi:DNA-binding NarL/FixJ family response regulator